jgi:transcriptional regulator with XRE-family HTH domain
MERGGERLKRVRERLRLTYREVVEASHEIAQRQDNREFSIALSRLADIENKGTVPSIFRLYTLCAIYRLNLEDVLGWYGVPAAELAGEALHIKLRRTHLAALGVGSHLLAPEPVDAAVDWNRTTFLSQFVRRFGKMPLSFLNGLDVREFRYGLIGWDDWSMYPILHPGSVVAIDDRHGKIQSAGWSDEQERPIYFLESREGYLCGWCTLAGHRLIVQPHPASQQPALVFEYPREVDVIGRVIGVAMLLQPRKRRASRQPAAPSQPSGL